MENKQEILEEEKQLEIESLREEIESLDKQLFELLERRLKVSLKIGDLKTDTGEDVYDPEREKRVIRNVVERDYDLPNDFVEYIMKTILTNMRSISQNKNE